jgi:hypothetical protein
MANLNLSEFTQKTFVADADWTFVWDTAGAISKKVSRNSWLSGTTANFRLGLADAAAPVAQTLSVQSVVAGTSNTAGVNFTIDGSRGTGTGAGGALLFRTAAAGSSGTTQNALSTALAITATGNVGIGTTAPAAKLEVALPSTGNVQGQGIKLSRSAGFFTLGNGSTTDNFYGEFSGKGSIPGNALSLLFKGLAGNDSDTANPVMVFTTRNGADTASIGNSQIAYQFRNFTTNLITVLGSGNLGIGTTAPSSKLHVAGTIKPEQATMVDKAAGFTLAAVDAGTIINSTSATAITINLPAADTATGYNVMIIQSGAGPVTIAQNGNTLNSFGGAVITAGQHAACSIVRTAASTYNLSGNLV